LELRHRGKVREIAVHDLVCGGSTDLAVGLRTGTYRTHVADAKIMVAA
jgi:hypothetical protein